VAFNHSGQDAAEFADTEEAVAAGIAAVCGESEPALQKNQSAILHALTRDMGDIEISAARAVREAFQHGSDPPGMKTPFATVAAPRAQTGGTGYEVEDSIAVRAKTILAATLGTNHGCSEPAAQDTEKALRGQGVENTHAVATPTAKVARRPARITRRLSPQRAPEPSGMDIATLLGDNSGQTMRQVPRPRRLNEFDPEYAR
jgi:hypothetical protein